MRNPLIYKKFGVCWFIIRKIPSIGIDELIKSVHDIEEFYRLREEAGPPISPITWKTKANLGKTYVRPVFPIVEDEDE